MGIEKTEELLNKFNYKFKKKHNKLIIELNFAQRIIVDFSKPKEVKISDRLVGWNFLTGFIEMNLKNATLYNFVGMVIITFLLFYLNSEENGVKLLFYFLLFTVWVLLWTVFYLVKAENMKQILIRWNE